MISRRMLIFSLWTIFLGENLLFGQMSDSFYSGVVRPQLETPLQSSRSSGSSPKESRPFTTEVLLFSVNHYPQASQLPDLEGCNNDMRAIKEWLVETRTPSSQITLLSDDTTLSRTPPTSTHWQNALESKIQKSCDRLIVAMACHGISVHGKSFLCPQDTSDVDFSKVSADEVEDVARRRNLIPLSDLLAKLKTALAGEVLLILDACRNHTEETSFMREFTNLLRQKDSFSRTNAGFAVITSCSLGQSALEIYSADGEAHGAFLYYFLEGLRGKADFAACYDGEISLVEAYNYAYSQVSSEAHRRNHQQTPEIFLSSQHQEMILVKYQLPSKPEHETDLQFLLRTGQILADQRYVKAANRVGVEVLDCVLENIPNHSLAYSLRGSIHRKLENYEQALWDLSQVGQKLQVYAKISQPIALKSSPSSQSADLSTTVQQNALLTITQINGNYFYVEEINNLHLGGQRGWISRNHIVWNRQKANSTITATPMQQQSRTLHNSMNVGGGGGVHSGGRGGLDPFFKI